MLCYTEQDMAAAAAGRYDMTQFLIRCFIKRPDDVKDAAVRTAYGNLASLVGKRSMFV